MILCWSSHREAEPLSPAERSPQPSVSTVPRSSNPRWGGDCGDCAESGQPWHCRAAGGRSRHREAGAPACPAGDGDVGWAAPCFTVICLACTWPFTARSHYGLVSLPCWELPGDKQEGYALQISYTHPTNPTPTACPVAPKPSPCQGEVPAGTAVPGLAWGLSTTLAKNNALN